MARIVQIYPGKDGVVRSALIKTLDGTLKGPEVKLALLYIERFNLKTGLALLAPQLLFMYSQNNPS